MNKKYVILGNTAGWLDLSWTDVVKKYNGKILNGAFPNNNKVLAKIIEIHYSNHANKYFNIPLKKCWFPYFVKCICEDRKADVTVIVYDWNRLGNDETFLTYIRKKLKKLTLIYVITNEVKYCKAEQNGFTDKLKKYYDIVYAFHKADREKYGFQISQLIYSWNDIPHKDPFPSIFFAGEAKQRFPFLLKVSRQVKKFGLHTDYHVLHVNDTDKAKDKGIVYDRPISYEEVIKRTQEATCVIEVPQEGLDAFTIKTCEAIFYNKLLITTYKRLKEMSFYDERYMLCIENVEEITSEFLDRWQEVQYREDARYYFSVERFLKQIEKDKTDMQVTKL